MTGTISSTITSTYNLLAQYTTVLNTGEVTVASGAAIAGTYVSSSFGWTVTNSGTVLGSAAAASGLDLRGVGDQVTNNAGGVISATANGIYIARNGAAVVNDGSIEGTGTTGNGVDLPGNGSVTNAASALITGGGIGVSIGYLHPGYYASFTGIGTVVNDGSIAGTGTAGIGVYLLAGGSVTNAASASIMGAKGGVIGVGGPGIVANYGSIAGTGTTGSGVNLGSGGSVTNATSALITGDNNGIKIVGAGTVVNAGSIAGTGTTGSGVALLSGGLLSNAATGTIDGAGGRAPTWAVLARCSTRALSLPRVARSRAWGCITVATSIMLGLRR